MLKSIAVILLLLLASSCFKTQSEIHYDELTKKGGKWHVDRVRVVAVNYSTGAIESDTTLNDVGDFTFLEGKEDENMGDFIFDGNFNLKPSTLEYGPFEMTYYVTTSSFTATSGSSVTLGTIYDITHLKKDKMNLFVDKETNMYFSQQHDFYFYFECTKI